MSTLRERLLEAMRDSGLNKTDLWKGCGLSSGAITHWFNGATQTLKGDSLLNAAKVLKVNPTWLNTGKGAKRTPSAHPLDEFKKAFDNAADNQKTMLLNMLRSLNKTKDVVDGSVHSEDQHKLSEKENTLFGRK